MDYGVIDAERIELESDSVDGVLCQSGYMLMADAQSPLSEALAPFVAEGGYELPGVALVAVATYDVSPKNS